MLQVCVELMVTGSDASLRGEEQLSQCRFARTAGMPLPQAVLSPGLKPSQMCVVFVCHHVLGWGLGAH